MSVGDQGFEAQLLPDVRSTEEHWSALFIAKKICLLFVVGGLHFGYLWFSETAMTKGKCGVIILVTFEECSSITVCRAY